MFPSKNRLDTKEFARVIKHGRGYSSSALHIKVMENSAGHIRTGVGVSKELARRPADKNYYKRVLKHILKNILSEKKAPYDVIVIARAGARDKKFQELQKDAKNLLQKTSIFSE